MLPAGDPRRSTKLGGFTPFGGLGKQLSPAAEPFAPVVASSPGGTMLLAPLAREPLAGLPAAERER